MTTIWKFPYPGEGITLSSNIWRSLPGSTVMLSNGTTYYEQTGAEDAPVLLFVHGFSVPSFIWDPTFNYFSERNYRTIRFDLYGRGYSERPKRQNDLNLFVSQLEDLVDALEIRLPITVIGLSMGGLISLAFANKHPNLVKDLVLIDPAGFDTQLPMIMKAFQIPLIGEIVFSIFGNIGLVKGNAGDFFDPTLVNGFIEKFKEQLIFKGYKASILSTIRNGILDDQAMQYRAYGELGKQLLLIWGENDTTVPFESHKKVLATIPRTTFHPIADTKHIPHYERPEIVNPIIEEFLSSD